MTKLLDVLERSAWTFVQAFAATVVVTGDLTLLALKVGAGAGMIAVLKSLSVGVTTRTAVELAVDKRRKARAP